MVALLNGLSEKAFNMVAISDIVNSSGKNLSVWFELSPNKILPVWLRHAGIVLVKETLALNRLPFLKTYKTL